MKKNTRIDSEEMIDSGLQHNTTNEIPDDAAMATTHAAMLGVWDKEADRFWVRNNLMLIANGLLLGGAVSADQDLKIKVLICFFGLFFSWSWLLMNKKSGHYVARWRPVIERYEEEMLKRPSFPVLPLTSVRPDKEASISKSFNERLKKFVAVKRTRRGAGGIMQVVILGFICAWGIFAIFYGFNLTRPLHTNLPQNNQPVIMQSAEIKQKVKHGEEAITPHSVKPPAAKPNKTTQKGTSQ